MSGIAFTVGFEDMAKQIDAIKLQAGLSAIVQHWAQQVENDMRRNATWTDRTGNARNGLFHAVDNAPASITARFGHTMEYGRFLELSNAGKYAIIMPSIQARLPELEQRLSRILEEA